jgi:hypothetical protein
MGCIGGEAALLFIRRQKARFAEVGYRFSVAVQKSASFVPPSGAHAFLKRCRAGCPSCEGGLRKLAHVECAFAIEWSGSNICIPARQALLQMFESKDVTEGYRA